MANITLGELRDIWKKVSDWVSGTDAISKPKVTLSEPIPAGVNEIGKVQMSGGKATKSVVVTLDTDFAQGLSVGIIVGTSGDLTVINSDGTESLYPSLAAGVIHPIIAKSVKSGAGTTATKIYACF